MNGIGLVWRRMASYLRIGHWRGHGVHSPFAYRFAREVFMERKHAPCEGDIYSSFANRDVARESLRLVQAAYTYFNCSAYSIDDFALPAAKKASSRCTMQIFTPEAERVTGKNRPDKTIVCLVSPFRNAAWYETCRKTVAGHEGMSIDCRSVIFLFHLKGLNKEHIKL